MTTLPKPYYDADGITLYCADCREILPLLPKVDAIITDPPYGIAKDRHRKGEPCGNGAAVKRRWVMELQEWDLERPKRKQFNQMLSLCDYAVIWGGNYFADLLPPSMGWIFWDKVNDGKSFANGELAWTSRHCALRVFRHRWDGMLRDGEDGDLVHPTQKPIELIRWCINNAPCSNTILDPYMGSGTTLRAAKDLGRRAVGIEINEAYCKICVERLRQQVLPLS